MITSILKYPSGFPEFEIQFIRCVHQIVRNEETDHRIYGCISIVVPYFASL